MVGRGLDAAGEGTEIHLQLRHPEGPPEGALQGLPPQDQLAVGIDAHVGHLVVDADGLARVVFLRRLDHAFGDVAAAQYRADAIVAVAVGGSLLSHNVVLLMFMRGQTGA